MRALANPWRRAGLLVAIAVVGVLGAGVVLLRQDAAAKPLRAQAETVISVSEAMEIAANEAGQAANEVELERRGSAFVYEVQAGRSEVRIDGRTGEVIDVRVDDDDDDDWDERDDALDLPAAAVNPAAAIAAAEAAAGGRADDIEVERYQGALVYAVEVGETDVLVDAVTGAILAIEEDR